MKRIEVVYYMLKHYFDVIYVNCKVTVNIEFICCTLVSMFTGVLTQVWVNLLTPGMQSHTEFINYIWMVMNKRSAVFFFFHIFLKMLTSVF